MSLSVEIGLFLALLTAFGSVAGFLYKFKGAREAPTVELRHPLRSTVELFRSPVYALGILIAFGSWGLHVGALSLAPISLVQSVIAGGLVLLTVVADRLFGIEVTRRELIGVGLTAAGLAFLAATLSGDAGSAHSRYPPGTLAIFISAVGVAGLILCVRPKRPAYLAVSAGLLWAASDTSIKALSSHLGHLGIGVLIHPLAFVILVASLVGLLISARSLQLGDAVPMIALTSAAANLTTIAAGPIVFGEPLPSSHLGLAIRLLAFALVIAAAALTPPPAPPEDRPSVPPSPPSLRTES
jgi:drug/metabolite transporter (DMT)-like permease